MLTVSIRFYEELNDFLSYERRSREYIVKSNDSRSVKDLIESQGVPHTEIDLILVNSESVGFDYKIQAGDRISVYPCFESLDITTVSRLDRLPLRSPRFIADVNLGKLSRHLRLLGLDCQYDNRIDDVKITIVSQGEKRIVLTRDRALLKRKSISHGIFIHSQEAIVQAREVIRRINLENYIAPFTRCLRCNGLLIRVGKSCVHDLVPTEIVDSLHTFYRCQLCCNVYWKGSHWDRLNDIIKKILTI